MSKVIYPDKHAEIISICRSNLNGVVTPRTSKAEKMEYGWKALEQLRQLELIWLGIEEDNRHE
jgi:hypothetical protein